MVVSLYGAYDNARIVIDHRGAGWVVFYSEPGGEFDRRNHPRRIRPAVTYLPASGLVVDGAEPPIGSPVWGLR
jgi:hypothetical protein